MASVRFGHKAGRLAPPHQPFSSWLDHHLHATHPGRKERLSHGNVGVMRKKGTCAGDLTRMDLKKEEVGWGVAWRRVGGWDGQRWIGELFPFAALSPWGSTGEALCLAAPLRERQPASAVSSAVSSFGTGLCCEPRVYWWPLGMQSDATWWIFNELFKNLRTCIEKVALKAH